MRRRRTPAGRLRPLSVLVEARGWVVMPVVGLLLAGAWYAVYAAGGSSTAMPHSFYIPILVAAMSSGVAGGVATSIVATVLGGPLMPLHVASSEMQEAANWLVRGGFFVTVGALAGASSLSLRRSFRAQLTHHLWDEVEHAAQLIADEPTEHTRRTIVGILESHTLHPVYQPIYDFADGRLIAAEALTRFETDPPLTPDVWFVRAAEVGLGIELELAAIMAAIDGSAALPPDVALNLNASPGLLADPRLLELLDAANGRSLIVEVTEHAVVDDYHLLETARKALRERGVRLAVDDAGAGFATLRHIVKLRPECIKLDVSLTRDVATDPIRRALADCLIQFAFQTGSSIIVEGIETASDLATWRDLGANAGQGYLLGRPGPLPLAATSSFLSSSSGSASNHREQSRRRRRFSRG